MSFSTASMTLKFSALIESIALLCLLPHVNYWEKESLVLYRLSEPSTLYSSLQPNVNVGQNLARVHLIQLILVPKAALSPGCGSRVWCIFTIWDKNSFFFKPC